MRDINFDWIRYKAEDLESITPNHPIIRTSTGTKWRSTCCPTLNQFRDRMYVGKERRLTDEVLDGLMDVGLMVWFLDSGGVNKGKAFFRTRNYSEQDAETMAKYFGLLGFGCTIESNRVELDRESTVGLMKVIAPTAPEFMYEKLVI